MLPDVKLYEVPSRGNRVVPRGRMDMTKPLGPFCDFMKACNKVPERTHTARFTSNIPVYGVQRGQHRMITKNSPILTMLFIFAEFVFAPAHISHM